MYRLSMLLLFIVFSTPQVRAASCCGSSTSSTAEGHVVVDHGNFLVFTGAEYGKSGSLDFRSMRTLFGVAYGITDRWAVSLRTGYSWLQVSTFRPGLFDTTVSPTDTIKPDTTLLFDNNGFDDGSLGVQYVIIPQTPLTKQELKAGASLVIPWGVPDKKTIVERRETLLPPKAQNGSDAIAIGGFAAYYRSFPEYLLALATSLGATIRLKDKNGVTGGPEVNATATAIVGPFEDFKGLLSVGYGAAARTVTAAATVDTTTGGQRITLSPAIDYLLENRAQFLLSAAVPVWQDENQKKIGNSLTIRLSALFFIPGLFAEN